jgi:hypothetical protein
MVLIMHIRYQVVGYKLQALKVKDNDPDDYDGRWLTHISQASLLYSTFAMLRI